MANSSSQLDLFSGAAGGDAMRMNYIRNVHRTVETYDIELRVLLELVQNSIDAIRRNQSIDRGRIVVEIDIPAGTVEVTDNGVGFPRREDLLFLGGTDKVDDASQLGKIGVGLKAVIFSTKRFSINSITEAYEFQFEVTGAAAALKHATTNPDVPLNADRLNHVPRSAVDAVTKTSVVAEFETVQLVDWLDNVYRAVFEVEELRGGETAAHWLYEWGSPYKTQAEAMLKLYLQTAPYIGDVEQLLRGSKLPIDIVLRVRVGEDANRLLEDMPHLSKVFSNGPDEEVTVECQYADFEALLMQIPPRKRRTPIYKHPIPAGGGHLGDSLRDNIWINRLTTPDEIDALLTDSRNRVHWDGLDEFRQKITGVYLVLGAPEFLRSFIPGGATRLISARGIQTAHAFVTPRGARHELFVPRIHMLINIDEDLNYGKRHLTNRWAVKWANDFFAAAYRHTLFNATAQLSSDVRRPRSPDDRTYVGLKNLDIESTLYKEPAVEQDVIGLFFDLAGRGVFDGYRVYGLSQVETYDGRFLVRQSKQPDWPNPTADDRLYALEFKYRIESLAEDIENEVKSSSEISLAIAWDCKYEDSSGRFRIIDTEISQAGSDGRLFPGVNAVLVDSRANTEIQLIDLKQIVEELSASSPK